MKPYLISAGVALASVALALAFFFAGFWARGLVDGPRTAASAPAPAAQTTLPPAAAAAPTATPPPVSAPLVGAVSVDDDPARGPENALVTIIEFSDFQCPFCKSFFDQTQPIVFATYGDRVRYVFRDFPIASLHPQAPKAAEAAQCAFDQGKFWEYHDVLFRNPGLLDVASLKTHATTLGLNGSTFNVCLDSGKYTQEVQKDFDDGRAYGVTGTPTFFINGRKLVGAQPYSAIQQVIEEELAKASAR